MSRICQIRLVLLPVRLFGVGWPSALAEMTCDYCIPNVTTVECGTDPEVARMALCKSPQASYSPPPLLPPFALLPLPEPEPPPHATADVSADTTSTRRRVDLDRLRLGSASSPTRPTPENGSHSAYTGLACFHVGLSNPAEAALVEILNAEVAGARGCN